MKYNNKSIEPKNWTTQELKKAARGLHNIIFKVDCYNARDLLLYEEMKLLLFTRGYSVEEENRISFIKGA